MYGTFYIDLILEYVQIYVFRKKTYYFFIIVVKLLNGALWVSC